MSETIGERLALDELEHETAHVALARDAIDLSDVRMIERREHLRLASQAREALGIGRDRCGQNFYRDVAAQLEVARAIDLAHAALAEQREQLIGSESRSALQRHLGVSPEWARSARP